MKNSRNLPYLTVVLSALCAMRVNAFAALLPVATSASLQATNQLDWSAVGVEYTIASNPFSAQTTLSHVGVTLSAPTGNSFERVNEGSGWIGNFASGESLLWTFNYAGPITLNFDRPLSAFGLTLQPATLSPFVATLEAFKSDASSLGNVSLSGTASTVSFLGARSDTGGISSLTISVTLPDGSYDAFAFNNLALVQQVPEPGTLTLLASGLTVALLTWRVSKKHGSCAPLS